MNTATKMSNKSNSTSTSASLGIRVAITSPHDDEKLTFTLSGVNVSIANAIRRILLSEIPMVVFRVSPNDKNKCNVLANTCGLHNEIVKHRLSCIPIHITKLENFPLKNYIMELNVTNNTDTSMYVTSKDFKIKTIDSGAYLDEEEIRQIFPSNSNTGDYIDFVRLKARPTEEIVGKTINLTCEFDVGIAKEDSAYNATATCAYGNTIDVGKQTAQLQILKHTWTQEGKNVKEVKFEEDNWLLLEGKRIFTSNSFDFIVETVGVYTNTNLVAIACKIMMNKLENLDQLINDDAVEIKHGDSTMVNCYDIILVHEDYTVGKVIEYLLNEHYFKTETLTFCGFKMLHPHDDYCLIRVAYKEPVEISTIKGHLTDCVRRSTDIFKYIYGEFIKLV